MSLVSPAWLPRVGDRMANALFSDLLSSIADRGRSLLERLEWPADTAAKGDDVATLCDALLSGRGEASGVALAQEALALDPKAMESHALLAYAAMAAGTPESGTGTTMSASIWDSRASSMPIFLRIS